MCYPSNQDNSIFKKVQAGHSRNLYLLNRAAEVLDLLQAVQRWCLLFCRVPRGLLFLIHQPPGGVTGITTFSHLKANDFLFLSH